jgi:hypothetical protein
MTHQFLREYGSKEPESFFWGHYFSNAADAEEKSMADFQERVNHALSYDTGGSLIPEDRVDAEMEAERRIRPNASRLSTALGIDLEDATKVLETSCVTREEFAKDPDACWVRFRGAAEELCQHEFVEAVDEDGELIEPASDICIHCGEERH